MLERDIVKQVCGFLDARPNCWYFKSHGGRFQKKGLPDIIGCDSGKFFGIELKRPGKQATAIQSHRIKEIKAAGGNAGVATCLDHVRQILNRVKVSFR